MADSPSRTQRRLTFAFGLVLASTGTAAAGAPALPPVARRPPPPPVIPSGTIDWDDTAVAARGRHGMRLVLDCPAGGQLSGVWGTDLYTDDSSLCSAAVHAGFIGTATGGRITVEIRKGAPGYAGSDRNGVTSEGWAAWDGSFRVLSGTPGAAIVPGGAPAIAWTDEARRFAGATGPVAVVCPAGGGHASLWGSGIYTDDSSICAAAVHAGAITVAGGPVNFELRPGQASYPATTSNGISSSSWGAWTGSFVILHGTGPTPVIAPQIVVGGPRVIDWSDSATSHRASVGQQFDYLCPAGGSLATVWGDGVYTDDSSICSAAVHAGLITTAAGGTVTIEMVPGEPSYAGTNANGVTTLSYGAWTGSYVFR